MENGRIRFGLLGIKNVGEGAIDAIIKARREKGVPRDFFTFIGNLDISQVNKKAVESLIKAGACDCLSDNRAAMLSVHEVLVESAQNTLKKNIEGQMSLFQTASETMNTESIGGRLPDIAPFPKDIQLAMEKEMLGVYLTDHPLREYADRMAGVSTISCDDIAHAEEDAQNGASAALRDGMSCVISGMISGKKTLITKSGKMMAFIDMEDLYGVCEVVVFPNVYERCASVCETDRVVAVKGTINFKEDEAPKILADEIIDIDEAVTRGFSERRAFRKEASDKQRGTLGQYGKEQQPNPGGIVKLRISANMNEEMTLQQIKTNLARHKGDYEVLIYLPSGKTLKTDSNLWVQPSPALRNQLVALLGQENVKM